MNPDDNCYGPLVQDTQVGVIPMTRGENGVWSCTIDTPAPESLLNALKEHPLITDVTQITV